METSYLKALTQLISFNTTSPIDFDSIERIGSFLRQFGFVRGKGDYWLRGNPQSNVCIYTHIDTKPPEPVSEWETDPWELVCRDGKLFGLGVSDAKFQLLNAILTFSEDQFFFVIDGSEEAGGASAGEFISQTGIKSLVVVDGSIGKKSRCSIFRGTKGQVDGWIYYDSGQKPVHPGREKRLEPLQWLHDIYETVREMNLHFNITGIQSPRHLRSLTLEKMEIRFDIRYTPEDQENLDVFLGIYRPKIKQLYKPLTGCREQQPGMETASFACPLGNALQDLIQVLVLPGGLPENGNHRPNEWIYLWQIEKHRNLLAGSIPIITNWSNED